MSELSIITKYYQKDKDSLLAEWHDEMYRREFGIAPEAATGVITDLATTFKDWLHKDLRQPLCEKWKYCEKKKKLGKNTKLAAALADFIAKATGYSTNGAVSIAVLLVEYGFDVLCSCGN